MVISVALARIANDGLRVMAHERHAQFNSISIAPLLVHRSVLKKQCAGLSPRKF